MAKHWQREVLITVKPWTEDPTYFQASVREASDDAVFQRLARSPMLAAAFALEDLAHQWKKEGMEAVRVQLSGKGGREGEEG